MKLLLILTALSLPIYGKKFESRCQLLNEMSDVNVDPSMLSTFYCVVSKIARVLHLEKSSIKFMPYIDTKLVTGPDENDYYSYGIFQFDGELHCQQENNATSANICEIECEKFLTDDITDTMRCAEKLYKISGLASWKDFKMDRCNGKLQKIDHCFNETVNETKNDFDLLTSLNDQLLNLFHNNDSLQLLPMILDQ